MEAGSRPSRQSYKSAQPCCESMRHPATATWRHSALDLCFLFHPSLSSPPPPGHVPSPGDSGSSARSPAALPSRCCFMAAQLGLQGWWQSRLKDKACGRTCCTPGWPCSPRRCSGPAGPAHAGNAARRVLLSPGAGVGSCGDRAPGTARHGVGSGSEPRLTHDCGGHAPRPAVGHRTHRDSS